MKNQASLAGQNEKQIKKSIGRQQLLARSGVASLYLWLGVWLCYFGVELHAADAAAAEETAGKIIRRVDVEGNKAVASGLILAGVHSRAGAVFNEELVSEDARRIQIMPEVYHVEWRVVAVGDQVDVIFTVKESPQIQKISILGNKHLKSNKLLKELSFKEGDFLDQYQVIQGGEALVEAYRNKGYYFATIRLKEDMLKQQGQVVYEVVEGPKVRIKKVSFEGNKALKKRKVKGKTKTRAYLPVFQKGRLDDEKLEQDCLALAGFYHEEGFLDAQVGYSCDFSEDKTRVTVRFLIEEGVKYRVASIRFEGNQKFSREELLDSMKLEPGQVLTQKRRVFAQRALGRIYGKEGYIYTRTPLELQYTDQEGEVDVVFKIEENQQYLLDRLIVSGNYQTRDKVIRRAFDYYDFLPGGIYDTDAAERAQKRLHGAGLFENITVTPIGDAPDRRDGLVEVTETRTGLVNFGVGVDTNSGVGGIFSIEQRNFDIANYPQSLGDLLRGEAFVGAGQQLRLVFMPGTRVTTGHIQFHEPYLFDQPYYMDLNLSMFRRWRESYLENRRGGSITLGHRFKNRWSVEASLRTEEVTVTRLDKDSTGTVIAPQDVQDVEGSNLLNTLRVGIGRDTTDMMFRPTEGYKLNVSLEQVGLMGGDFSYAAANAGGTLYHTVYEDIAERKTVWAGQISGSKIIDDAPVFERYYAGGIGSLRGFDYRGVSPRDGIRDYPIGSEYILLAGTEMVHPLFEETIYGKIFCDSGLVSEGPYRVTVGFGLELVIPQLFQMIPMHFDFGFPLLSDDKDEEELFSFNFGSSMSF